MLDDSTQTPRKKAVIYWIVASATLFVIAAASGYMYYRANRNMKDTEREVTDLSQDNDTLTQQLAETQSSGTTELEAVKETNTALAKDKKELEDQVASYQAKISKANAYNEFYKHLNSVIETHGGFTGWTDAEFQTGKTLAEKTGDTAFVNLINWAWYETSVNPTTRVIEVWKSIASNIENALK